MRTFLLLLCFALVPLSTRADDKQLRDLLDTLAMSETDTHPEQLQALVKTGDLRLEKFFDAYREGSVYQWSNQAVVVTEIVMDDELDEFAHLLDVISHEPMTGPDGAPRVVDVTEIVEVEAGRTERKLARSAKFLLGLRSPDKDTRLTAVKRCGVPPREAASITTLEEIAANDPVASIRYAARESAALIRLTDTSSGTESNQLVAAQALGDMRSARGGATMQSMLADTSAEVEPALATVMNEATEKVAGYQKKVKAFDGLKFGLSTGSIFILMALGLAIIYGLMGVINMAHGELMMVGAYTTFVVQQIFGHGPGTPHNEFFLVALPASFLVAALVGGLIEWLVVRHLYHRPLESLLATVGVSFILIQIVRLIFGDNQASNSPTWLSGSFNVAHDMSLSFNRVFIFFLTVATLIGVLFLLRRTVLGLQIRATMQNRGMAASLGVNTRLVYSLTFMLGSGIAGLAGCALTTVSGITPNMGQNYIVESFLIVVVGGVGNLAGVVCSGLGLGVLIQFFENTFFGPVWSKILILCVVVAFIQFRPSGLFPPKGRLADD